MSETLSNDPNAPLEKKNVRINCINSSFDCLGQTSVQLTIGFVTPTVSILVIPTPLYHFILDLDYLRYFNLRLDNEYRIFQDLDFEGETITHEIHKHSSDKRESVNSLDSNHSGLDEILTDFPSIFSTNKYDIGSINLENCNIGLISEIPIALRPYRCSKKDQKILD